jgi:hypothetical protein
MEKKFLECPRSDDGQMTIINIEQITDIQQAADGGCYVFLNGHTPPAIKVSVSLDEFRNLLPGYYRFRS